MFRDDPMIHVPSAAVPMVAIGTILQRGVHAGRDILPVGFTDRVGKFDPNRWLSVKRVQTVEQALRATLPPGAPDQAGDGRTANRRVEANRR